MNEPLSDGNATLLAYTNGAVAIVKSSGGPNAGPNVAWARQSLAPIVRNGRLNPALNTDPNSYQSGYTLGGAGLVWRTRVDIDGRGNLIFVVADNQTVITLAQILQRAGAVRRAAWPRPCASGHGRWRLTSASKMSSSRYVSTPHQPVRTPSGAEPYRGSRYHPSQVRQAWHFTN